MAEPAPASTGQAQEFPAGRLASFEDDTDGPDLGMLLARRVQPSRGSANGSSDPTPDRVQATPPETLMGPASPGGPTTDGPASSRAARGSSTSKAPSTTPRHSEGKNRIRSSSVHIPAALVDKIVAERERSGRSNGQIVIAAIEAAHPRLGQLIAPAEGAGGALFQQRSSRVVRTMDGPLTPLNVRLFEDDYEIIDQLVAQFGAFSRGHLITAALTDYLTR
jgi:hypothetical protein